MPVLVVPAASAAGTALSAATAPAAARWTGIADKVIAAAVLIAATTTVEVPIDIGVAVEVLILMLILVLTAVGI
jgi:hypothetical protein